MMRSKEAGSKSSISGTTLTVTAHNSEDGGATTTEKPKGRRLRNAIT